MFNLQYRSGPKWSAANCACLMLLLLQYPRCQERYHINWPSANMFHPNLTLKHLFNLWFSQLQGQFSKVTRKQSRVLQGWLQQWEATHPLVVQYLAGKSSSSLHAVERGHLSLHCRDDIYTCASLDIKNMIYIYFFFPCNRWQLQTKLLYNWDITIKSCAADGRRRQ